MIEQDQLRSFERIVTSMLARAAADDPDGFAAVAAILDRASEDGLRDAARSLRWGGYSWSAIARAMGRSKSQVAWRFGESQRLWAQNRRAS